MLAFSQFSLSYVPNLISVSITCNYGNNLLLSTRSLQYYSVGLRNQILILRKSGSLDLKPSTPEARTRDPKP